MVEITGHIPEVSMHDACIAIFSVHLPGNNQPGVSQPVENPRSSNGGVELRGIGIGAKRG
jgi:hypothetical protein